MNTIPLFHPKLIAVASTGNIIVVHNVPGAVQILDKEGGHLSYFNGSLEYGFVDGITIDLCGRIIIAHRDQKSPHTQRLSVYSTNGNLELPIKGEEIESVGCHVVALTVNSHNDIIAADVGLHRILIYNCKGDFQFFIGGVIKYPVSVATNSHEGILLLTFVSTLPYIVVVDTVVGEVMTFRARGQPKGSFSVGLTNGELISIATDSNDNLIMARPNDMLVTTPDGKIVTQLELSPHGNIAFNKNTAQLFIAEPPKYTIQIFNCSC